MCSSKHHKDFFAFVDELLQIDDLSNFLNYLRKGHVVVVIQFLSSVLSAEMAGFTPFLFNCSQSVSPLNSIQGILLQTNLLCLFFHLLLSNLFGRPRFLFPLTSRSIATLQITIAIPSQHMSMLSNSLLLTGLVFSNPNMSICS